MTTLTLDKPVASKADKIIYWVTTTLFFLFDGLLPALTFTSELAKKGTAHLGYPNYFAMELGIGKIIGGLLLILPFVPPRYKEWAYVGYGISVISAFVSNLAVDGATPMLLIPVVAFAILLTSYIYFHKLWDYKY